APAKIVLRVSGLGSIFAGAAAAPVRVSEFVFPNPELVFEVVGIAGDAGTTDDASPASASVSSLRSVWPFVGAVPFSLGSLLVTAGCGMSSGVGARPGPVAAAVCSFDGGNSPATRCAAVSQSGGGEGTRHTFAGFSSCTPT